MLQAGLARTPLLSIAPHSTSFPLGIDSVGLGEFSIEEQIFGTVDYTYASNLLMNLAFVKA
jgi:hypothetical protein